MDIKKNEMKMYFKERDIWDSYYNNTKLYVTNDNYCNVIMLGIDSFSFAVILNELVNDNILQCTKVFKNVKEFNTFVKYQRWLND